MAVPLTGFEGTVTVNGSAIGKVTEWDGSIDFKENEYGPYVGGDGSTDVITSAKTVKGKLECIIPEGGDDGQDLLITSALAFGTVALILDETDGYVLTIPVTKVTGIGWKNDANGTGKFSFQFRNSGTFTFVPS